MLEQFELTMVEEFASSRLVGADRPASTSTVKYMLFLHFPAFNARWTFVYYAMRRQHGSCPDNLPAPSSKVAEETRQKVSSIGGYFDVQGICCLQSG